MGPVLGAEATHNLSPWHRKQPLLFDVSWPATPQRWLRTPGLLTVSCNLRICFWSQTRFYGESSSLKMLSLLLTCLVAMAEFFDPTLTNSNRCLQACTATSCRQDPYIEGQVLPPGTVLTHQMSYELDHWSDNTYIFKSSRPQTYASLRTWTVTLEECMIAVTDWSCWYTKWSLTWWQMQLEE